MVMFKSVEERKVCLRRELKSELDSRGYKMNQDCDLVTTLGSSMTWKINLNITNDGLTLIASWSTPGSLHRIMDPDAEKLADAIITTITNPKQPTIRQTRPPRQKAIPMPPSSLPNAQATASTGVRVAEKVSISREEFNEYQELKRRAKEGVFITKALFEDMKYGYIPPNKRAELNRNFDLLIRRMSI